MPKGKYNWEKKLTYWWTKDNHQGDHEMSREQRVAYKEANGKLKVAIRDSKKNS